MNLVLRSFTREIINLMLSAIQEMKLKGISLLAGIVLILGEVTMKRKVISTV